MRAAVTNIIFPYVIKRNRVEQLHLHYRLTFLTFSSQANPGYSFKGGVNDSNLFILSSCLLQFMSFGPFSVWAENENKKTA